MDSIADKLKYLIKSRKHKNSKLLYYTVNGIRWYLIPRFVTQFTKRYYMHCFNRMDPRQKELILQRVNYYNKISAPVKCAINEADGTELVTLNRLKPGAVLSGKRTGSMYFFDAYQYMRYFKRSNRAGFLFGDITYVPRIPSFVKSRPIKGDNSYSVLLPLDKNRHFTFVKDKIEFTDKKDMLIGRAFVDQPHRIRFWELYFGHPMCNLGNINRKLGANPQWNVSPIAIDDHLHYKYILCLEGNDVASNLKWVMSSNSIAVMPQPVYETWFMEGTLIPGYHYIEIKPDYSDLIEKLNYYTSHPAEAQKIIDNAHEYVNRFRNHKREVITGLIVAEKYFGQIST